MVDLVGDKLAFPLRDGAAVRVSFVRTLRVPDTGTEYDLPAGFGHFPVRRMETLAGLDASLKARGGIAIPMWQAEALWIQFETEQPAAIKIGAGRINALTGKPWQPGLHREPQDYVVAPDQPWLDGFVASPGIVRQFVAAPLGYGATVAEQISDDPDEGGIQIVATPLTHAAYAAWKEREARISARECLCESKPPFFSLRDRAAGQMGLGVGGRIRQQVYDDPFKPRDWSTEPTGRVSVTIFDALRWKVLTGACPPTPPITARDYARAGIPWFTWYDEDARALAGSPIVRGIRSVQKVLGLLPGEIGDMATTPPIKLGPESAAVAQDIGL